jgi:protocatechuate 3,4-dioxygenase beta subunit
MVRDIPDESGSAVISPFRMRPGWRVLSMCVGTAALCAAATAPAQQPGDARTASTALITGRVVDGMTGDAVAGAVVAVSPAPVGSRSSRSQQLDRIRTDAAGRFFFRDLPAGGYRLTASKAGWLEGAYGRRRPAGGVTPLDLKDGDRRADVTIAMWRPAVIAGRVFDETGEPIVNADVRAMDVSYRAGRRHATLASRLMTDDRGMFRFSDLVPGDYVVMLVATVKSESAGMSGASGDALQPYLQTMAGVATPTLSTPLSSSTRAHLVAPGDRWLLASLFEHPGLPAADGAWTTLTTTFHPSATSLASAEVIRARSGTIHPADVVIRWVRMHQVAGSVSGPDGPAAFHAVHLLHADEADTPSFAVATAVTDQAGEFRFFGVPPGSYVARVVRIPPPGPGLRLGVAGGTGAVPYVATILESSPEELRGVPSEPLLHASRQVSVGSRDVTGLELLLQPGPRIRGRAEFVGSATPPTPEQLLNVTVWLEPANGRTDSNVQQGRFTSDGRFFTPSQWPDRYLMSASSPAPDWTFARATVQGRNLSDVPFALTSDVNDVVLTFVDRTFTISGSVAGTTEHPAAGARVLLFPQDSSKWVDYGRTSRSVSSATVTATGTYSLPAPPAGDYFLVVIPDEFAVDWRNPSLLGKLAPLAERIRITDGTSATQPLRLRELK